MAPYGATMPNSRSSARPSTIWRGPATSTNFKLLAARAVTPTGTGFMLCCSLKIRIATRSLLHNWNTESRKIGNPMIARYTCRGVIVVSRPTVLVPFTYLFISTSFIDAKIVRPKFFSMNYCVVLPAFSKSSAAAWIKLSAPSASFCNNASDSLTNYNPSTRASVVKTNTMKLFFIELL